METDDTKIKEIIKHQESLLRKEAVNRVLEHSLEVIASLMGDEIREQVHQELAPCSKKQFVTRYCQLHYEKYGQDFVIS